MNNELGIVNDKNIMINDENKKVTNKSCSVLHSMRSKLAWWDEGYIKPDGGLI